MFSQTMDSSSNNLNSSGCDKLLAGAQAVVPFTMKLVPLEGQFSKLFVRHLEPRFVGILVQLGPNVEPCFGGRAADQIDHALAAGQGAAAPVVGDVAEKAVLASRAGESHPHALLEPYVNLSIHTAPDVRPLTCRNPQWTKRFGLLRTTRVHHSLAPFGRRRLNLLRAQRIRKASILRNVQDSADL